MNPNSNRRAGLKHEGEVRKWFNERGFLALNLAPNDAGDVIVFDNTPLREGNILECKRTVRGKYRTGANKKQRDRLLTFPNAWWCVSFYGKNSVITRFVPAENPPKLITPVSGLSWEAFLDHLVTGN